MHRIHGDFHLGNLLLRDGVFNVLDFDDMLVGPAVQDLWLALSGRDDYTRRQRECFLEGYERFREFDRSTLRLIEPLRGMRMIHYATWLARRWHDPDLPQDLAALRHRGVLGGGDRRAGGPRGLHPQRPRRGAGGAGGAGADQQGLLLRLGRRLMID